VKPKNTKRPYVVVRTYSAGVFAGELVSRSGQEVKLTKARRLWYWNGAASLSQLALEGVTKPNDCKFAVPVDVVLTQAIEILSTTPKSRKCIEGIPVWRAYGDGSGDGYGSGSGSGDGDGYGDGSGDGYG